MPKPTKIKGVPGIHMLSKATEEYIRLEGAAWAKLLQEPTINNLSGWCLLRTSAAAYVIQDIASSHGRTAKKKAKK